MTDFQIFGLLVSSIGCAGQFGDAITSGISFSKGATEGNPVLAKLPHWALYAIKIVAGGLPIAMVMCPIPEIEFAGVVFGVGAAIVGIEQTLKNIQFLKGLK